MWMDGGMDGRRDRKTDRQAGRHDEVNSHFPQFCPSACNFYPLEESLLHFMYGKFCEICGETLILFKTRTNTKDTSHECLHIFIITAAVSVIMVTSITDVVIFHMVAIIFGYHGYVCYQ